jgi:hypothetical protein
MCTASQGTRREGNVLWKPLRGGSSPSLQHCSQSCGWHGLAVRVDQPTLTSLSPSTEDSPKRCRRRFRFRSDHRLMTTKPTTRHTTVVLPEA